MHYIRPFSVVQLDMLRYQAVNVVAARLGLAEPPLRKEVVECMSDVDSHLWSMRRSKANFFRLMTVFSGVFAVGKWFGDICMWKKSYYNSAGSCAVTHATLLPRIDSANNSPLHVFDRGVELQVQTKVSSTHEH